VYLALILILGIGLGLVVVAVITAVAAVYLPDPRADRPTPRAHADRRRVWADPNEAARAAGSWG
jgi:hypothetical protein